MKFIKSVPWLLAGVALLSFGHLAEGADHSEAPGSVLDQAADIADVYVWHEGSSLHAVITVGGLANPSRSASYDEDILTTLHLDQDADNVSDVDVLVRFGQNRAGAWGVQVENLPGATGTVAGAVDRVIDGGNGTSVYAGLRDDPFFFDLQGFNETLATGTLSFDNTRDSVAGLNATAIVLTMNLADATGSDTQVNVWATTARK